MTELALQLLDKYGLPTAFLGVMVWLFIWLAKNHREERKEWRSEQSGLQTESNKVLRNLTEVIARINNRQP